MSLASSSRSRSAFALPILALIGVSFLPAACASRSRDFDDTPEPAPVFSDVEAGVPEGGGYKCIREEVTGGEPVPLSMIILLDRSGSMVGERWTSATNAIRAFVDRAEVVGMKVGLQFFPPLAGDQCSPSTYAKPSVPIDVLPDNVIPIQQRLAATSPTGGTPMSGAVAGSVIAMQSWLADNDPHAGAIILVTDGDPAGCGNIDAVASAAQTGAKGTPTVKTFAVGMEGATFSNLDKVALAGAGAPKAFNVGGGAGAQQALFDALDAIRTGVLSCEYVLPRPKAEDGVLDLDSVELKLTPGENDPTQLVRRVADKAACGETTGGFYYDDPVDAKRIILCPASCTAARGGASAKLDVVLGCIQRPN
ncbi:MAG: VWA domain-containing protein [Labilithrix sp.]|nr:VWA domain-containing protein [Labilithrix sp.]